MSSEDSVLYRRKRKVEWKRRQRGQTFLDFMIINVQGGTGGNGCVAFNREKFKPFGPPSGGNGGHGGDVYILPTPHLTTLSSVPKRIKGANGTHGQGTWQNGKAGPSTVIRVPLGTVVRELPRNDPRRSKDEYEMEEEGLQGLSPSEREEKMRQARWVHYPGSADRNLERDSFKEAEQTLHTIERERAWARRRSDNLIQLDLDSNEEIVIPDGAPLGLGHRERLGHLLVSGGQGGLGNPHFLSAINRSPKWATKGQRGERVTLSLELKLLADVGLVGMPNAGKSTLLRAITGGRAKSEVAGYAFTTLNPVVGVVRVARDGTFEGDVQGQTIFEESAIGDSQERMLSRRIGDGSLEQCGSARQTPRLPGRHFDIMETFRFTIADNPGLVSRASENVGLGHSFLRSLERSLALAYVVDFAGPEPWDQLRVLQDELEKYKPGMSHKAKVVIANKADLLSGDGRDQAVVIAAKEKLQRLEDFVKNEMTREGGNSGMLDVVPISAKFSQNLRKVVSLLRIYVQEARGRVKTHD